MKKDLTTVFEKVSYASQMASNDQECYHLIGWILTSAIMMGIIKSWSCVKNGEDVMVYQVFGGESGDGVRIMVPKGKE